MVGSACFVDFGVVDGAGMGVSSAAAARDTKMSSESK